VSVAAGGGSWSSVSDRNRKENFLSLDGEDVLARLRAVPVSTWNYRAQDRSIRHMGPMAQDLYAAFRLGESDLMINTVDIDGINMSAVQAVAARTDELRAQNASLHAETTQLRVENASLHAETAQLRARLERIEALLAASSSANATH
jgi:hypothetical protein